MLHALGTKKSSSGLLGFWRIPATFSGYVGLYSLYLLRMGFSVSVVLEVGASRPTHGPARARPGRFVRQVVRATLGAVRRAPPENVPLLGMAPAGRIFAKEHDGRPSLALRGGRLWDLDPARRWPGRGRGFSPCVCVGGRLFTQLVGLRN